MKQFVMVIDDSLVIRTILETCLQRAGYEVRSFPDGVEALRIDPADAAPEYWHHVHNRLSVNETPRPYTSSRHQAWLHRRRVTS